MARGRSKSLVQSIALEGPGPHEHEDPAKEQEKVLEFAKSSHVRSRSIPRFSKLKTVVPLDPFTPYEFDALWEKHISGQFSSTNIDYDFENWDQIEQLSQLKVQNFITVLNVNLTQLNGFKGDLKSLKSQISDILSHYETIHGKTKDFNTKSQALIKSQNELHEKLESISAILRNFENLDDITRKLSTPNNLKLIRSKGFPKILENLDTSLEFLNRNKDNSSFKNIEIYKIKFRQCMTRSLTLIKDYLVNELRRLETTVNQQQTDLRAISVYKEFQSYIETQVDEYSNFPNLSSIFITRIEKKHELEYKGLFLEILNSYFRCRTNLVDIRGDLSKFHSNDLVKYSQDNLSYISKLLAREHKLFKQFFGFNDMTVPDYVNNLVYEFFKNLIEPFYDSIRERLLRETNISLLCQLTNLLQNYYEFEDYKSSEVNLGEVFQSILDDCQSRLIFKIQLYIDNKLIPYKPTPEDLNIGNKKKSVNELDEDFKENLFEDLYLPLGKALTILSNIYELINSIVFDDLAHYIVHSCIEILRKASVLSQKYSGSVDSKLFYLKNLIILKYQLSNFDIQFVRTETSLDFTSGLNELYTLIRNGDIIVNLNQNGWFNLIKRTVPKVINNMIDAKTEVELEINNSINELLSEYLNQIIEPLNKPDKKIASSEFKTNIHTLLPQFKKQITAHLNDYNILKILFNNLMEILVNYYDNYYSTLTEDLNEIIEPEIFNKFLGNLIDDLLDDLTIQNNLLDIKTLLKFDEELELEEKGQFDDSVDPLDISHSSP